MDRTTPGHVDHVVLGTRDADATADRLREEFGFVAGERSVLDGTGWANRGIPLGRGTYLELLTVHDVGTPEGAGLAALVADGDRWMAWAVRLLDLEDVGRRAGTPPVPGSRGGAQTPAFWTVRADPDYRTNGFLPFFVAYNQAAATDLSFLEPRHTGRARSVDGIATLELSGPGPEPVVEWLGNLPPEVRIVEGPMGVRAVEVRVDRGTLRIE